MLRRIRFSVIAVVCTVLMSAAQAEADIEQLKERMEKVSDDHPRLLVTEDQWPSLEARVMGYPVCA